MEGERPAGGEELSEDNRPRIPASEILAKIEKGETVRYLGEGIIVVGDLDLRSLDLPTQHVKRTKGQENHGLKEIVNVVNSPIIITNSHIEGILNFGNSILGWNLDLDGCTFEGEANFYGSIFEANGNFVGSTFEKKANFYGAIFEVGANFMDSTFNEAADFRECIFNGSLSFWKSTFSSDASFWESEFNMDFVTFRYAKFKIPWHQESACMRAKMALEKSGDREEAGYHFYREMDAKRKLKPWYIRFPELVFIQWVFGYGVHPLRLWGCWLGFVGIFALLFWYYQGIDEIASQMNTTATVRDYIWFSIATAVTPGYAGYKPTPDFKLVAGLEAIIGTFMWAAFIATFSRKYMR